MPYRKHIAAIVAATLIVLCGSAVRAAEPLPEFFREETIHITELVVAQLRETLPAPEKQILDSIKFVYPNDLTQIASPSAYKVGGKRIVSMNVGFYRTLGGFGDLAVISQGTGRPTGDYMPHVIPKLINNSRLPPEKREHIKYPYDFYGIPEKDAVKLRQRQDLSEIYAAITLGGLSFVVAHEIAHHVLGHIDNPLKANDLEGSRNREEAADAWACRALLRTGYLPLGAIYALKIYYHLDQDAIAHERERTHPAELRRFEAAIDSSLEGLPLFKERIKATGETMEGVRKALLTAKEAIRKEIGEKK
jgi:hypothetical protein